MAAVPGKKITLCPTLFCLMPDDFTHQRDKGELANIFNSLKHKIHPLTRKIS